MLPRANLPAGLAACLLLAACPAGGPPAVDAGVAVHTAEFVSGTFSVDRLYPSMHGPTLREPIRLAEARPGELIWITAVRMEAVDLEGNVLESQENLCHAQIRSAFGGRDWLRHNRSLFEGRRFLPPKWFTLIAGQFSIQFPPGFGIPMYAGEPLSTFIMLLNQDPDFEPFDMRVRTRIQYVYDRDVPRPMTALSKTGFETLVYAAVDDDTEHGGEGCGLSDEDLVRVVQAPAGVRVERSLDGRPALMHFLVAPGRHEYRNTYRLTGIPQGVEEISVHYVAAHLHLHGESIELIDRTTGKSVFRSVATPNAKGTNVADMSHVVSPEGIRLYRDHDYELITVYDNPTDREVDAMGVVYLYYADPTFQPAFVASR